MLDAPVVRRQPRYSSSTAVRQWEMTTEYVSAKNKRVSCYQAPRSVRFTAIAFLPNYKLIKISRRRASRRVTHVGAFIYLSRRRTHAHTRAPAHTHAHIGWSRKYFMQIFAYASAKNKNQLSNLSTLPYRVCWKTLRENSAHGFPRIAAEHMFHILKESQTTYEIDSLNLKTILR